MQERVHHRLFMSVDLAVPSQGSSSDSDQMTPRLKAAHLSHIEPLPAPPSALYAELITNMENSNQVRGGHGQAESPRMPHRPAHYRAHVQAPFPILILLPSSCQFGEAGKLVSQFPFMR